MKNLFKLVAIAGLFIAGITTTTAQSLSQDGDRPEVIAKETVAKLAKYLDLSGDQERALFRAYVQKEVNYKKNVAGKDVNNASVIADMQKYNEQLKAAVKKTLNAEQFKKWQAMQPQ